MWKYGLLQIILLLFAYGYLGWLYGTLFIILFIKISDFILSIFGYYRFNYGDLGVSFEMPGTHHNLSGYFVMEKIDFKSFKKYVYERAIIKIPKLHSLWVHKYGIDFWKIIDQEAGKNQISKLDKSFKTEEELMKY